MQRRSRAVAKPNDVLYLITLNVLFVAAVTWLAGPAVARAAWEGGRFHCEPVQILAASRDGSSETEAAAGKRGCAALEGVVAPDNRTGGKGPVALARPHPRRGR